RRGTITCPDPSRPRSSPRTEICIWLSLFPPVAPAVYATGSKGGPFYNFSLLLSWLERLLRPSFVRCSPLLAPSPPESPKSSSIILHGFTDNHWSRELEAGGSRPRTLLVSALRRGRLGTIHTSGVYPLPA